jgi:excisionase family DNA binding protein
MSVERLLLKPSEFAEAIGVSRSKAYEILASGSIPVVRLGGPTGTIRVPVDGLKKWLAEQATVAA